MSSPFLLPKFSFSNLLIDKKLLKNPLSADNGRLIVFELPLSGV